jgi:hypothetical protein
MGLEFRFYDLLDYFAVEIAVQVSHGLLDPILILNGLKLKFRPVGLFGPILILNGLL